MYVVLFIISTVLNTSNYFLIHIYHILTHARVCNHTDIVLILLNYNSVKSQSMSVYERLWASMSVYERLWASMSVHECPWASRTVYMTYINSPIIYMLHTQSSHTLIHSYTQLHSVANSVLSLYHCFYWDHIQ